LNKRLRRLWTERKRRLNAVEKHLLAEGSLHAVERDLQWVALFDRWRRRKRQTWIAKFLALGTATAILAVVFSVWVRLPRADFRVELLATSVDLQLGNSWRSPAPFDSQGVVLAEMDRIASTGGIASGLGSLNSPAQKMEIRGAETSVEDLLIEAESLIKIIADGTEMELSISRGSVSGFAYLKSGNVSFEDELGQSDTTSLQLRPDEPPEEIRFQVSGSRVPARVVLLAPDPAIVLRFSDIAFLSLLDQSRTDTTKFHSSVLEGEIRVLRTDTTTDLQEGDFLQLAGLVTRRVEITRIPEKGLRLVAEGSAKEIRAGPENHVRNLKPTLLTFVYSQSLAIGLLWVVLVLLPSAVWQVSDMARRGE